MIPSWVKRENKFKKSEQEVEYIVPKEKRNLNSVG